MHIKRFLLVMPVLGALISVAWALGCAGGNPTTPDVTASAGPPVAQEAQESGNHVCWGEWLITMRDVEDSDGNVIGVDFEVAPLRSGEKHWDVTKWLRPPHCYDCVRITPWGFDPGDPYSVITARVELKNPFGLTGYDVRGIIYPPVVDAQLLNPDGLTTLFNDGMPEMVNAYKAFAYDVDYREFAGYEIHGRDYVFRKLNTYRLLNMAYKVTASWPDNAPEPVDAQIGVDGDVYPHGSDATIVAEITDWQNDVASVSLDLAEFGFPTPQEMTWISEDPDNFTSFWQYDLTEGVGGGEGWRTARLTAYDSVDPLTYMKDFDIEVTWDQDGPEWCVDGEEGIYDHIAGPQLLWLFFYEACDVSLPILYKFYGNDQSPPFDGADLKVRTWDQAPGYTQFGAVAAPDNALRYYGIRLQDAQGWPDDNMLEYSCVRYPVEHRWSFIKDQPPGQDGIMGGPAIGDVNGDGRDDIVVGARNHKVYVYDGTGTGTQDTVIWEYETGGEIQCAPALADLNGDGRLDVVVASDDGNICAVSGATGLLLWTHPAGVGFLMHGSPAIAQLDTGAYDVICGTGSGIMLALAGEDGSEIWSFTAGQGIAGTPGLADVTGDGTWDVCFGAYDQKVYMLDGATGEKIWEYFVGPGMYNIDCSPVRVDVNGDDWPDCIIGARRTTGDFKGILFALDGVTGEEIWTQTGFWGNCRRTPAPVKLDDDNIWDFIVTNYNAQVWSIYAVNGADGSIMYHTLGTDIVPDSPFNYSAPIVGDFTGDGHLDALYGREDGYADLVNIDGFDLPGHWPGYHHFNMQVSTGNKKEIFGPPAVADVDGDGEWELIACNMRGYTYVLDMHAPVPSDPALRGWTQHQGNRWHTGVPEFTPPDE